MMQNNIIDAILTEDTDLIAHLNNNILYKLDHEGSCFSVSYEDVIKMKEFESFSSNDFLVYCILCVKLKLKKGCDYFKMKSVGPKSAFTLAKKYLGNIDLLINFLATEKLVNRFAQAFITFKLGLVNAYNINELIHKNNSKIITNMEIEDIILNKMFKYVKDLNFLF